MANGRVEIHDPLANLNDLSRPDADNLQDMLEFRLLMAYTKRRRRRWEKKSQTSVEDGAPDSTRTCLLPAESQEEASPPPKTKKKKKWKRLPNILMCIKPQPDKCHIEAEGGNAVVELCGDFRSVSPVELNEEMDEEMDEVASRLTEIADEIPFAPPEYESDGPDDDPDVEKLIGILLRECGDNYDEEVTKGLKEALSSTQRLWSNGFFDKLMTTLLKKMGLFNADPEAPGPQTSPKTQMAVTCEVTSRLSAADTLAGSRLLGYGATYLQNHFSSWAKQQGGYEAAFDEDDDEEDDVQ
ncbi:apoptosis facilitator Bcl-2-like protein 14 [Syngnathus typhle]|uniref:apoptosis facilitator Bcl-2-like protein 14 n=1 Tax=Syngnathus typhle TaxID=161592 RepID=UPI002A6A507B|nr:apoptosis facilitator Bcl-2-like protein 14 [Syngnathus typhle]XP_061124732.1 apoptosis facilitator Bcl-2-like protein 14 [Syngnathus typhle]XP_061124733.1 apoptosis facilitator Bcl-2-like protein 14 [Syngnathus typhle]XP_061124734.1 apoptosis facilitator Bcl-2-like protein 14 [Syngnathus typhle]XP_061124735.1 apoptosis facilitator Bcl-2-like protein 14 [Syngnathus typhle]